MNKIIKNADNSAKPVEPDTTLKESEGDASVAETVLSVSTKPSMEDGEWIDRYGVKYSADKTKLIDGTNVPANYSVLDGCEIICNSAFAESPLTSITIPDSVTSIGNAVFQDCLSLPSITIPKSVTHIGHNPFVNSGVHKITCLSPDFEIYCGALFEGCTHLISCFSDPWIFFIPETVTSIGDNAFWSCQCVIKVIPKSVTSIGNGSFAYCSRLCNNLTIPDSVTSIGERAFMGCDSFATVSIPSSIERIEYRTFADCEWLQNITIPDSVQSIGGEAFKGCTRLRSITVPDTVTSIGDRAFADCTVLQRIFNTLESVNVSKFLQTLHLCSAFSSPKAYEENFKDC